jgi:two-component system response regulator
MREILVVEDSDDDAEFMQRALKGARVANPLCRLADGTQALDYLKKRAAATEQEIPSVLLLDIKLPGASGFEILSFLKEHPAFSTMLKVVVSDLPGMESIRKAYSIGAQSFLVKPVHPHDVSELIKTFPSYWAVE